MIGIADKAAQDSRTMRIITVVTMFYLPANLVVSFFSTVFVEVAQEASGRVNIQVRREIWIAILTILVFASITFLPTVYLDRRGKLRKSLSVA